MKMKKTVISALVMLIVLFSGTAFIKIKSSNGIASETGSPSEGNCGGCHGGGFSLASGSTISATPSFTNNEYLPSQVYTMSITFAASGFNNYGFGCEILNSSNNTNAGTMQNAGPGVKFLNGFGGRKNAVQTVPKNGTGAATFTFEWVAPSVQETVKIYAAGNCVDLNGNTSGDFPLQAAVVTLTTSAFTGIKENTTSSLSAFNVYPNPATDKINLNYNLKEESLVSVELVSINGQQVTSLINEKQLAGDYQRSVLIPHTMASGVYFLKISANNQKVAQRLITVN